MLVVAKGTQKGFIFLYEILKASIASLKTCHIENNNNFIKTFSCMSDYCSFTMSLRNTHLSNPTSKIRNGYLKNFADLS